MLCKVTIARVPNIMYHSPRSSLCRVGTNKVTSAGGGGGESGAASSSNGSVTGVAAVISAPPSLSQRERLVQVVLTGVSACTGEAASTSEVVQTRLEAMAASDTAGVDAVV